MNLVLILCIGILIGFLVALPPGAIAVVCIQRTLCKSRRSGFISGLGAANANTVSATIAAFFLGVVLPFIEENLSILKIVCGVCIIILGISIVFKKSAINMQQDGVGKRTFWGDFFSVFTIALINPAFILTYMAFYAFFGISREIGYSHGVWLIAGVFLGASLWWFVLTSGINHLRHRFQARYIIYLNRVSGTIIAILGLIIALSF